MIVSAAYAPRNFWGVPAMNSVAHVLDALPRFDPARATFNASDLSPASVVASVEQFGCAWIKGLFDPAELARFDAVIAANIEGIENVYRDLGFDGDFNIGFPLYFASEENRNRTQGLFKSTYPGVFDPAKMTGADTTRLATFVFAALQRCGLTKPIARYLDVDELCTSAAITHIRNFKPRGDKWFGEFHQDNKLYDRKAEILTLWFPFRYEHGRMPSLEFLPVSLDDHLPTVSACGIDNNLFEAGAFWRPAYRLGDAMLLSGFVPHRTYIEPGMTRERTSVDFRFFASAVPAPIYARPMVSKVKETARRAKAVLASRAKRLFAAS
jgi:hypothetical protein